MGVRLPPEYQEVEFLQSTGSQCINTGINVKSGLRMRTSIEFTRVNAVQFISGGYGGSPRTTLSHFHVDASNKASFAYNNTTVETSFVVQAGVRYNVDTVLSNGNQSVVINGQTIAEKQLTGQFTRKWPIWLFANNNDYSSYRRHAYAKMYYNEIIDIESDNLVVRQYVPCYRKSDNEPGMYDLISDALFTNIGTGKFIVGPDVESLGDTSPWLMERRRSIIIGRYCRSYPYIITENDTIDAAKSTAEIEARLAEKGINVSKKLILANEMPSQPSYPLIAADSLFDNRILRIYRNIGDYQAINSNSTSYYANSKVGTKFLVIDPTDKYLVSPYHVVADKDYKTAPATRNFIQSVVPAEGNFFVYKSLDMSRITDSSYDLIFGLVTNGAWRQGTRMYRGAVSTNIPAANWGNSSYACVINAGDTINFIPIKILT